MNILAMVKLLSWPSFLQEGEKTTIYRVFRRQIYIFVELHGRKQGASVVTFFFNIEKTSLG